MKEVDIQSIKDACTPVFEKQPVVFAYLFGSLAGSTATSDSDADIAVFLPERMSKEERFELRLRLMSELGHALKRNVDVVILNDVISLFFKYVILKEGMVIYEASEASRLDFAARTLSLYFDFLPFLNQYNRAYVQRGVQ